MAKNKEAVRFPANVLGDTLCGALYFLHFPVHFDDDIRLVDNRSGERARAKGIYYHTPIRRSGRWHCRYRKDVRRQGS